MADNHTCHAMLIIGDVSVEGINTALQVDMPAGTTTPVRITREQACMELYSLADLMCGGDGDELPSHEAIVEYFRALTQNHTPEVVGAILMDSVSWQDAENMFVNGPNPLFPEAPCFVAHLYGDGAVRNIERVRN